MNIMETMNMKSVLVFLLILCLNSCRTDDNLPDVTDPKEAILGKWELIADASGPVSYEGSYREFRTDSIVFHYVDENDFAYGNYWFDDSVLYIKDIYIDDQSGDTIFVDIQPYEYGFPNHNRLELTHVYPFLNPTTIYKRSN